MESTKEKSMSLKKCQKKLITEIQRGNKEWKDGTEQPRTMRRL